ncbi:MAG: NAD(P)-binding domain-containing protein, partial [Pirellulales bacterium]|nr:NAD(P)-binding domain-containing protein [Pirellulales bacterium]
MANPDFHIAVVGSGPAGLSAAARAAQRGISHVLLEAAPQASNTIFRYQKGKHVMDEPPVLPLRSDLEFIAGTRENILDKWNQGLDELNVNIQYQSEVTGIQGQAGDFTLTLGNGGSLTAAYVVFAIGLQGNIRKLGVEGEDLPYVQYQLDDPEEYFEETIVVVGAGDAGIENAVGLAAQNNVVVLNRGTNFERAKQANNEAILSLIRQGVVSCTYGARVRRVQALEPKDELDFRLLVEVDTATGTEQVYCHRIIARLGALPPRPFVESCGIEFPSEDRAALPQLSSYYESNVKGLYIIGALGGFPLIKTAMNQGYEVVEYINGNLELDTAETPLLYEKFGNMPGVKAQAAQTRAGVAVDEAIRLIQSNVPLFAGLTSLQLKDFMLESEVRTPQPGETIFEVDEYSSTFFSIVQGSVAVQFDRNDPSKTISLHQGQFFGELGLISGRPRTATVLAGENCVLIETPKRATSKLIKSVASVKRIIDHTFMRTAIRA